MCCKHEGAKEILIFHSHNCGSPCTIFRAECCMCRQHAADFKAVPWKKGQKKLNGGPFDVFQTVVRFGRASKTRPFDSELSKALHLLLLCNPNARKKLIEQFGLAKQKVREEVRIYLKSFALEEILPVPN
jgi:hypothetical protein